MLLLLEEQTGESWNPSKKNTLRYHGALETNVFNSLLLGSIRGHHNNKEF